MRKVPQEIHKWIRQVTHMKASNNIQKYVMTHM